jgi:phosphate starvation-inducible PhoH-like protein
MSSPICEINFYEENRKRKRTRADKEFESGPTDCTPLEAKTEAQAHYILSINSNIITFGIGPSGTGKTAVATMLAVDEFKKGNIKQLVVTRPIVEVGDTLGFLPGTVEQKQAPYLAPIYSVLLSRLGRGQLEYCLKAGSIEAIPLELMRGRNFNDCWVLLDEAQNTTVGQMKMFLTRVGKNAKVVINGDVNQIDIDCQSGLIDATHRFNKIPGVGFCYFTWDDVVRSRIVKEILKSYEA